MHVSQFWEATEWCADDHHISIIFSLRENSIEIGLIYSRLKNSQTRFVWKLFKMRYRHLVVNIPLNWKCVKCITKRTKQNQLNKRLNKFRMKLKWNRAREKERPRATISHFYRMLRIKVRRCDWRWWFYASRRKLYIIIFVSNTPSCGWVERACGLTIIKLLASLHSRMQMQIQYNFIHKHPYERDAHQFEICLQWNRRTINGLETCWSICTDLLDAMIPIFLFCFVQSLHSENHY